MLSIGEFSKLCMVTTKTLRYYDSIGLLKPVEYNEENGYRFYSVEQTKKMLKIKRLREYDFSLEEIAVLIDADEEILIKAFENKIIEKKNFIKNQKQSIRLIQKDIIDLKKGDFMNKKVKVSLVETKDMNIAYVKDTIAIKDFCVLMERLLSMKEKICGAPIAIYHSKEFNPDETIIELGYPTDCNSENTRVIKGGLCVKGVHVGAYPELTGVYAEIVDWINKNGYKISNPPYDVYLNDPKDTPEDKLITEIYFPVEKE